jgi:hypothetical protein
MDFDAATGQVVLFGGLSGGAVSGDTWVWNGTDWTQQFPAHSPSARQLAPTAFDMATGQLVLFGGVSDLSGTVVLGDTWVWNGTDWTQQSPAHTPPARDFASMAFDAATGQVVLFGGFSGSAVLGDTWVWNGTDWTQQSPAHSPPARDHASMAFDAATGQLVLFGGPTGSAVLGDTWVWNGTDWTQQFPAHSPSPREDPPMAFDAATGQLVLFGGLDAAGHFPVDTWVWNGTDWTQQFPAHTPPGRVSASIAFDTATGQLVLFGGEGIFVLADTWVWGPPRVTIALTGPNGGTPDGANGWFVHAPVTGTVTADNTTTGNSTVSAITCSASANGAGAAALALSNLTGVGTSAIASGEFSLLTQGTTVISCTATDAANNTSAPTTTTVNIDTVPPVVTCQSPAPQFVVGRTGQTVSANVTDPMPGSGAATSGIAASATTTSAGTFTVGLTGSDNAGNSTSVSCGYGVVYGFGGFISPLPGSTVRSGVTIPVKFGLTDALGQPINATLAAALAAAGNVTVTLTGPGSSTTIAASVTCTWNPKHLFFQCSLKTPTGLLKGSPGYAITVYENVGGGPVLVPSAANPETVFFK